MLISDARLLVCVVWWSVSVFVFFFFQAEDGIRDTSVTGVQTCALPIYKMQGRCRNENRAKKKRAAAATRNGQYKKRGRCRKIGRASCRERV